MNHMLNTCLRLGISIALIATLGMQVHAKPSQQNTEWTPLKGDKVVVNTLFNFAAGWADQSRDDIQSRPLFSLHRGRVWLRGSLTNRIKYVTHFAFDRIGADEFSLLQGKAGSTSISPKVQDLFLRYDALDKGLLRVTGGFFRPTVGRENNSAVIALPSHEVALTGVLARRGSVGTGAGRAPGVNVGGRIGLGALRLIYQTGIFGPTSKGQVGETEYEQSMGSQGAPLLAASMLLNVGSSKNLVGADYLFLPNSWSKPYAFTFGASTSMQGATEIFEESAVYSGFAALNLYGLFVDGEYVLASRTDPADTTAENTAWHVRAGYNLYLDQSVIAPFVLVSELDGQNTEGKMTLFSGKSRVTDAGVNWHLNRNALQVGFHAILVDDLTAEGDTKKQPVRSGSSYLLTFQIKH